MLKQTIAESVVTPTSIDADPEQKVSSMSMEVVLS